MVKRLLFFILIASCMFISTAGAAPTQWSSAVGGNDHYYDWISDVTLDWDVARDQAETLSYMGMQGHLVTITSADEDVFVQTVFDTTVDRIWFGGYQLNNDAEPDGNWAWVTGETWEYANFMYNCDGCGQEFGHQDYLQWWHGGWDDNWITGVNPHGSLNHGYIIEYESTPIVPEPISSTLFIAGAATLGFRRFRRS